MILTKMEVEKKSAPTLILSVYLVLDPVPYERILLL